MNQIKATLLSAFFFFSICLFGQDTTSVSFDFPQEYEIGGITISGTNYLDQDILIYASGLKVGDKINIPGEDISQSIKNLWKQKLFSNVSVYIDKTVGKLVFINIDVDEKPRLSRYVFEGIKKHESEDLREKLNLVKGRVVTDDIIAGSERAIKDFYKTKGFSNATVKTYSLTDTILRNSTLLGFKIDKGNRVKINDIYFTGNENVKEGKLKRLMKKTKNRDWWTIFSTSKFNDVDYENDKQSIINYYNSKGYRNARIVQDTVYMADNGHLNIEIKISEGKRFYFRDIKWKGNQKYTDDQLTRILNIDKGTIYNQEVLERRLFIDPNGSDITSIYMDDGYLFFQVTPVETAVTEDSIDLEIRIYEGAQATIGGIIIKGNDRTHEKVIRRELRTIPGNKFSRSDIIRSQREIANLGFFNPETIGIQPKPDPEKGTVDIEYTVEEKPSDQLELTMSWGGAGQGLFGSAGVTFTNFSLRNMFTKGAWSPLPQGDGQRLSFRFQSNGRPYQSINLSFTEPWLGGKKANSLTVGFAHTRYNLSSADATTRSRFLSNSVRLDYGKRLSWPDDFFTLVSSFSYQQYYLENYQRFSFINNGRLNDLNFKETLARNSIDSPIYPMSGSNISLSVQFTPPYSLFGKKKDYDNMEPAEKFKFLEYHKWRFDVDWYTAIIGKLVFRANVKTGYLGFYNRDLGFIPLERYKLGGDGLSNFVEIGQDVVSLRGYDDDLNNFPANDNGATIFNKYTLELRYPITTNPSTTAYVVGFFQAGNVWNNFKEYDPFNLKRSAGLGFRIFLPMFGTLGFDYGIGFDDVNVTNGSKWSEYGKFSIVLGFEPD